MVASRSFPERIAQSVRVINRLGGPIRHGVFSDAARELGCDPNTVKRHWHQAGKYDVPQDLGTNEAPADQPKPLEDTNTPQYRRQVHDADFWKRDSLRMKKLLAAAEHRADELAGVVATPVEPARWMLTPPSAERHRVMFGMQISDAHTGEVVDPVEVHGVNQFDIATFRRRFRQLISTGCHFGKKWSTDEECVGALLAFNGDLTSGDIHEELMATNALTSHEQVDVFTAEAGGGIEHFRDTFGRVHCTFTPGNHARTSRKPQAKRYGRQSYDTLIGKRLLDMFKGDDRVTFQIARGADLVIPVFGRSILQMHGDNTGTGGGKGFAGPALPIARGGKNIELQFASAEQKFDLLLTGHYHTSMELSRNHFANGSIVGYNEYARNLRAPIEIPMQWAFLLHEKWWVRERCAIKLEEPPLPEKPRYRVTAGAGAF